MRSGVDAADVRHANSKRSCPAFKRVALRCGRGKGFGFVGRCLARFALDAAPQRIHEIDGQQTHNRKVVLSHPTRSMVPGDLEGASYTTPLMQITSLTLRAAAAAPSPHRCCSDLTEEIRYSQYSCFQV